MNDNNICPALKRRRVDEFCKSADGDCAHCPMVYLPDYVIQAIVDSECTTVEEMFAVMDSISDGRRYPDDY